MLTKNVLDWTKAKPPKKFDIRDWLLLEEVFARILEVWGSPDLAASELHLLLLDGRLEYKIILTPRAGFSALPRSVGPRFWRQVQLVVSTDGVRLGDACEPPSRALTMRWFRSVMGDVPTTGHVFIRRAEFDALYPPPKLEAKLPSKPEAKPRRGRIKGRGWASDIAKRMKDNGAIPEGTGQEELAEMIVQQMQEEAAADPSLKPLTTPYVRTRLPEWKLWPINLI
jgi:hypothetical protein